MTQGPMAQRDELHTQDPWAAAAQSQAQAHNPTCAQPQGQGPAVAQLHGISGPRYFGNMNQGAGSPFEPAAEVPRVPASFTPCGFESPVPTRQRTSPFEERQGDQAGAQRGFEHFQRFVHARGMDPRLVSEFQSWVQGQGAPAPGAGVYINPHANYGASTQWRPVTFEICRKKNEALSKFNGSINDYSMWASRIKDHLCRTNRQWVEILESLQTWTGPVYKTWLIQQSHSGHNAWELS